MITLLSEKYQEEMLNKMKFAAPFVLTTILMFNFNLRAATNLGVGDVAILAFNGDG